MNDEIIVVTGQPRSGTTMMMRMLEAGGVPLYYDESKPVTFIENGIEHLNHNRILREVNKIRDLAVGDTSWVVECLGMAVKVLVPLKFPLPHEFRYKFIYMDRKKKHMAKSQQKYMERVGRGYPDRGLLMEHVKGIKPKSLAMLRGYAGDLSQVAFEAVLKIPKSVSVTVAHFLGMDLDVDAMAGVVVKRPTRCLDTMMEEEIYTN